MVESLEEQTKHESVNTSAEQPQDSPGVPISSAHSSKSKVGASAHSSKSKVGAEERKASGFNPAAASKEADDGAA